MFWKNRFSAAEASSAVVCSGRGISIAVLDTGISPVADFIEPNNRIVAFLDLVNGRTEPYDDNGHGTQLTGTNSEKKGTEFFSVLLRAAIILLFCKTDSHLSIIHFTVYESRILFLFPSLHTKTPSPAEAEKGVFYCLHAVFFIS